jgi:hypothetical protein
MTHNLNVHAYTLLELLGLFDITSYNITVEDMRRAKKKTLMTHPDQSRLPSTYFMFYRQAYEIIYHFYQEQTRQKQSTENVGDYEAPAVDDNHHIIQQSLEKMSARDFQSRFNQLFDQMDMGSRKPDPQRNAWFHQGKPVLEHVPDRISPKDMSHAFQTVKTKNKEAALALYRGVQDMSVSQGTASLYEEEEDEGGGVYISSDVFSKLKFDDLRKVHKDQTVLAVSESDFEGMPKYRSVDHYAQQRGTETPLAEHEAQRLLEEQARIQRELVMQREYQAQLRVKENEKKNQSVLSQFLLLTPR